MMTSLPLYCQLLIDVKYLGPNLRSHSGSINAIPRLVEKIWKCLGDSAHQVFGVNKGCQVDEVKDLIKLEWSMFQIEKDIPDIKMRDEIKKSVSHYTQPSYWKKAYELAGIEQQETQ